MTWEAGGAGVIMAKDPAAAKAAPPV
jgi:hypothetical protein